VQRTRLFRLLQFRLRTLLLLLAVLAIAFAWLGWAVREAELDSRRTQRQRQAVEAILAVGGIVEYSDRAPASTSFWRPAWIRRCVSDESLHDVVAVRFDGAQMMVEQRRYDQPTSEKFAAALARLGDLPALEHLELGIMLPMTDDDLSRISRLTHLRRLIIYGQQITDAGLEHLASLTGLERLSMDYTSVTDEGIERLRRALPACGIEW
jgi:hypothetical protein